MATTSPVYALPAPQLGDPANIESAVVPLRDRIEVVLQQIGNMPIGSELAYAGSSLPTELGATWVWANGGLIRRDTYATFFTRVGHTYNGGLDPGTGTPTQGETGTGVPLMRLPDKRGRAPIGADDMGGSASGGALPSVSAANKARGARSGVDRVPLVSANLPAHAHTISGSGTTGGMNANNPHTHDIQSDDNGGGNVGARYMQMGINSKVGLVNDPVRAFSSNIDHGHSFSFSGNSGNGPGDASNNPVSVLQPYEVDLWIVRIA